MAGSVSQTLDVVYNLMTKRAPANFNGKDNFYNAAVAYLEEQDARKALEFVVNDLENKSSEERRGRPAVWKTVLCDICSALHGRELGLNMVEAARSLEADRKVALDNDVHVFLHQVAREMNKNSGLSEIVPEDRRKG